MRNQGYCGIGIEQGKNNFNYGTLFRTAQILNVDFLFVIGARFQPSAPDVFSSHRHMPVFSYADWTDFQQHRPFDCPLFGIEMMPNAWKLNDFVHPQRAIYLLGAEDHGLTRQAQADCQGFIVLPGERSMNVSVAGSIVLYDRFVKLGEQRCALSA
jgi:tRNA (guanosine-2'-O-)-methyltransferase